MSILLSLLARLLNHHLNVFMPNDISARVTYDLHICLHIKFNDSIRLQILCEDICVNHMLHAHLYR
jgi:hypothetical protein